MMISVVALVIVGALAFFGGMKYQESKSTGRQFADGVNSRQGGQIGQGRFGGGNANGNRPVTGEILSVDDKSITVKLQDGSSKIVLLSDKTMINKATEASKSDLKVGGRVLATGTSNSDGSITAQNIQLNPLARMDQSRQNGQPNPTQ